MYQMPVWIIKDLSSDGGLMTAPLGTYVYLMTCVVLVVTSGKKWMLIKHNEELHWSLYLWEDL